MAKRTHSTTWRAVLDLSGTPSPHSTFVPTGTIWPSGDFSLGYKKVEGDSRVDGRSLGQRSAAGDMPSPDSDDWYIGDWGIPVPGSSVGLSGGVVAALDAEAAWANINEWEGAGANGPLDLTTPGNSHRPSNRPEKYGKLGITGYGRKMVKSAATLMAIAPGSRLTFATVTMPTLPPQLRRELSLVWPDFLRQLLQWLSRRLKRLGLPQLIVSVSEIQPGRLSEYSEAYLHLHLVWPNPRGSRAGWAIDVNDLRTWISEFLQRKGIWTNDAWVNVDTQLVKKSASAYLAKYMSKGSAEIEAMAADVGWDCIPGQWWNMTKQARELVKKYTRTGVATGQILRQFLDDCLTNCTLDVFHVLRPAMLEIDGTERIVGWFGVLTAEARLDLISMLPKS